MTTRPRGNPGLPRAVRTTEAAESAAFFAWVELHRPRYPALRWVAHWPNEGKRAPWLARAMGLSRGVPDVVCFVRAGGATGWTRELKLHPNKPTPEQLDWLAFLAGQGWDAGTVTMREAGDWVLVARELGAYLRLPSDVTP